MFTITHSPYKTEILLHAKHWSCDTQLGFKSQPNIRLLLLFLPFKLSKMAADLFMYFYVFHFVRDLRQLIKKDSDPLYIKCLHYVLTF